jgi:transcriptional regulator GlxA family with amidase domain
MRELKQFHLPPDPRIRIVLDRLSAAGTKRFPVKELAHSVNLSPARFSHLFALATGLPPARYMRLATRSDRSR